MIVTTPHNSCKRRLGSVVLVAPLRGQRRAGADAELAVRFTTSGATSTSATGTTDADGRATYCYDGPLASGTDTITAHPDLDGDGMQDVNEPSEQLSFSWTAPLASDGCKVTLGGAVTTADATELSFGGNFRVRNGAPLGSCYSGRVAERRLEPVGGRSASAGRSAIWDRSASLVNGVLVPMPCGD